MLTTAPMLPWRRGAVLAARPLRHWPSRWLAQAPTRATSQTRSSGSIFETVASLSRSQRHCGLMMRSGLTGASIEEISLTTTMATKLRPELDAEIARLVPGGLGSRGFGEDAVFVRPDGFGIADGIGHWLQPIGYNSALFSRLLMHYVAEIIDDHSAADVSSDRLAVEMLQRSFDRIGIPGGSSTALIGTLHDDTLHVANIGDCRLIVWRDGHIILHTEEQLHDFNFPFQLGAKSSVQPKDAALSHVQVQPGDVIVCGSDGLFDNLFDDQIFAVVEQARRRSEKSPTHRTIQPQLDPQYVSDMLFAMAKDVAQDSRANSPFEQRCVENGIFYRGGKMDDISIITAVVVEAEDSPDRR